ncbi:MAG: metallophosphoesterase [Alphaproteobacteria bacterium RIFCSPHIGHO2_01_FULL_41_14]|nr:MAG: metallophosphoesterase [Alphaproteobacteria bacterium GWA1_45_9]OFW89466.1 MAG: metallophosphoesterase [Alphaproteobacteria bacterium RIFCSPHIGHO2_01_FULL_41_14]HCI48632.1 TIGR00282 family metallophosphoesterase [Holosporales bacterium]
MKILMCGDIVGRAGRDAILKYIPSLRKQWSLDIVVANGENAAHGFGITEAICESLYKAGVDVITTGNHIWDQKEILPILDKDKRLLRPLNYPEKSPGHGMVTVEVPGEKKVVVINVMGRLFMDPLDDPFAALDKALSTHTLGGSVSAILIDFHGEASSEKMAAGYYVVNRATALVGTHTHVPTSDTRIMPGGLAYQTDLGMTGDYDSVVGMQKTVPIQRFTKKYSVDRLVPAEGEATLCGLYIETDDKTGKAILARPVRVGGLLSQTDDIEI